MERTVNVVLFNVDGFKQFMSSWCFPVSLWDLTWDQIFSIGFKSGLWDLRLDLFSSYVLMVFAVWAGALSCWKITSDCGKQAFLQYSPVFQSMNWLFTVNQLTNTSSWKGSPNYDTSSSMLNCGRDAFTIVLLTRSSNTPLWSIRMQLKSWFITPQNSAEPLNQTFHIMSKTEFCLWCFFLRQQWPFNTSSRHNTCIR